MGQAVSKGGTSEKRTAGRRMSGSLRGLFGAGNSGHQVRMAVAPPTDDMDASKHEGADPFFDEGAAAGSELPIVGKEDLGEFR